ncbi:MAG TPA: DUF4301 family protein, partial [bacterium]|nr:DUF4301 family protein [bacterium]
MNSPTWTPQDLKQMKVMGLSPSQAGSQLDLFLHPPPAARLDRPATVGDGVVRLKPAQRKAALAKYRLACRRGRFLKFVPASGAASRMFQLLMRFLQAGPSTTGPEADVLDDPKEKKQFLEFMNSLARTPFFSELKNELSEAGEDLELLLSEGRYHRILRRLLLPGGMDYARKPKGLVPFHRYSSENRTPLEEHLVEALRYVKDGSGVCRVHFTVSPEHEAECRRRIREDAKRYGKKFGVKFAPGLSIQSPGSNTLAVDKANRPFRDDQGRIVFRPGGHGALLGNLNRLKGDLVYIKNIDNVVAEGRLAVTVEWKKILGGLLASTQEKIFKALGKLQSGSVAEKELGKIERFLEDDLGIHPGAAFHALPHPRKIKELRKLLDRPLRVCGVVPATGEPGGGPFWVRDAEGRPSLQIVESAQVDLSQPDQKKIFEASTHFNPVDLVCGVRDWKGKSFDLKKFVDPQAVF